MISLNLNQPSPEAAALIENMVATLSGNTVAENTPATQPLLSGQPWAAQGKFLSATQPSFSGQPWAAQGKFLSATQPSFSSQPQSAQGKPRH